MELGLSSRFTRAIISYPRRRGSPLSSFRRKRRKLRLAGGRSSFPKSALRWRFSGALRALRRFLDPYTFSQSALRWRFAGALRALRRAL